MAALSRRKGANAERWWAHFLAPILPECRRRFSSEESQGTDLGADLAGSAPFRVQVKEGAHPYPLAALLQAAEHCPPDELPIACCHASGRYPHTVTMRAEDWRVLAHFYLAAYRQMPRRVAEVREEMRVDGGMVEVSVRGAE